MSERKMSARWMRIALLVWLCFLAMGAVQMWIGLMGEGRSNAPGATRARIDAFTASGLSVLGLVLVLGAYRRSGVRTWKRLRFFFGITGLVLCLVSVAALFLPERGGAALSAVLPLGVIQLMFWDRLRDSVRQRNWEQDHEDVAPVFD